MKQEIKKEARKMGTPEALILAEDEPEERKDRLLSHFRDLLEIKKFVNGTIDDLFEAYPELEEIGRDGRTPAQKVRDELDRDDRRAKLHLVK